MWSKLHDSPWAKMLSSIFEGVDMLYIYRNNLCCNVNSKFEETWLENALSKPKLKTYMQIKQNFGPEPSVLSHLSKSQISSVAHLGTGVPLLATETGQLQNIPEEIRLCGMCDLNGVKSESHFLLYCTLYDDLKESLFSAFLQRNPEMSYRSDEEKLKWLFNFNICRCAHFRALGSYMPAGGWLLGGGSNLFEPSLARRPAVFL